MRGEPRQPFGVRRLEVDRDAVGELHGAFDLSAFGAGHDLEVHVAADSQVLLRRISAVSSSLFCVFAPPAAMPELMKSPSAALA